MGKAQRILVVDDDEDIKHMLKSALQTNGYEVITAANGEELAGVKLIIKETGDVFFSDLDGNFKITIKTDKIYSVSIETIGFQTLEIPSNKIGMFTDLSLSEL